MSLTDDVARLADSAKKLLQETERMHRDVLTLLDRIEPFENETVAPSKMNPPIFKPLEQWRVVDAMNEIRHARGLIEACERDLSAIRSRIDSIADDVYSREELKPWLRRQRKHRD